MKEYENIPSGAIRRAFAEGSSAVKGDPAKMAQVMIACADRTPAPKRLARGGDTYVSRRTAQLERLAAFDAQRDTAYSTDVV